MYRDGVWSVRASQCERASVFSSCRYMCTTSVSPYLLSSVCFQWHKCIVKRHSYLWGADKQPNTTTGVFFNFFRIPRSVDCSDFEHNARNIERHTTWGWIETIVYLYPLWVSLLGNLQPPPEPKMRNGPQVRLQSQFHESGDSYSWASIAYMASSIQHCACQFATLAVSTLFIKRVMVSYICPWCMLCSNYYH